MNNRYNRQWYTGIVVVLFVIGTVVLPGPAVSQDALPSTVELDPAALVSVRTALQSKGKELRDAYRKLVRDADKAIELGPWSVMQKQQFPPSGDKHDYMSLSRYWWPDPSKPDGLPYIRRDGETNPEIAQVTDNEYFDAMTKAVSTLALAYFYSGEERYAERAAMLLRTWFLDPEQRMNPNDNFGQMVKGKGEKGSPSGLLDMRGLVQIIDAMALLRGCAAWTTDDSSGMKRWFEEYYAWFAGSDIAKKEYAAKNNHGVWASYQITGIAVFLGKTDDAKKFAEEAKSLRIAGQITPEGVLPKELERTRSLHYTLFNLDAFFSLASVAARVGVDLFTYQTEDGRSIRKALDYALPFITGEKKWEEEQIDEVKLDKFFPVLLQAWTVYGEAAYRSAADQVIGENGKKDRANLLFVAH